jgi:hypothetical protein
MSRSRRKTLSHTEIENFLFDLTTPPVQQSVVPVIEQGNLTKADPEIAVPITKTNDLKESIRFIYQVIFGFFIFFSNLRAETLDEFCFNHRRRQISCIINPERNSISCSSCKSLIANIFQFSSEFFGIKEGTPHQHDSNAH